MSRALLVLWLAFAWVLLWGEPSPGNVAAGLLLGTVLVLVVPPGPDRRAGVHPVAVVRYGLHFAWALVTATTQVVRTVLSPRMHLEEAVVAVPLRAVSPVVVTFVANSITLTPGTLTVDIRPRHFGVGGDGLHDEEEGHRPPVLYVHVLHLRTTEEVKRELFQLRDLTVRALGSSSAIAALEQA